MRRKIGGRCNFCDLSLSKSGRICLEVFRQKVEEGVIVWSSLEGPLSAGRCPFCGQSLNDAARTQLALFFEEMHLLSEMKTAEESISDPKELERVNNEIWRQIRSRLLVGKAFKG